ncbi:MAG: MATE family efflux transporter [bacterium]|nr:MATE family efflux transporter [bacterium]
MTMNNKTELFETAPLPKALMALCVPTIISSLVTVIYNLADTFFVGMLNDSVQTAAVTLAGTVLLAFNAVNNLFGVGVSSVISRSIGIKNYDRAYKSSCFGFYCSVLSGILFSIICVIAENPLLKLLGADAATYPATSEYMLWTVYLGAAPSILNVVLAYMVRSEGASVHAGIGTMGGCILNIILDPIFIMPWGLGMGASGAGFATFISNCAACFYFFAFIYVKRGNTFICINPRKFTLERDVVKEVFAVGVPAAIQNLLNVIGMAVLNKFAANYGAEVVSAMGITRKLNMVPMYAATGFSQGIMPLVGYTYAAKMYRRMKDAVKLAFKIVIPMTFAVVLLYFIGSEMLISLFMNNETVIKYGTYFLCVMALSLPFAAVDYVSIGVFQAQGNGKIPFVFAVLRKVILDIPILIILNKLFMMYGLPYSQLITEIVLAAVALVMLKKEFDKCVEQ